MQKAFTRFLLKNIAEGLLIFFIFKVTKSNPKSYIIFRFDPVPENALKLNKTWLDGYSGCADELTYLRTSLRSIYGKYGNFRLPSLSSYFFIRVR